MNIVEIILLTFVAIVVSGGIWGLFYYNKPENNID